MNDQSQLGFADFLTQADTANRQYRFFKETAHLPGAMKDALPRHRLQIRQHHAVMLAGDIDAAMRIREEAHQMAVRVNGGDGGILAGKDAPGCVLARRCAAGEGKVPLWGQDGRFDIELDGLSARIVMHGMFGIGSSACPFPGFEARAVDPDRPFISETGSRSFVGIFGELVPGMTVDGYVRTVIESHVSRDLKGRLRRIKAEYRH